MPSERREHAGDHHLAVVEAVGELANLRQREQHAEALRREQQAGGDRRLAAHLLVVERQDELRAEAAEAREQVRRERGADGAVLEETQIEERGPRPPPRVEDEDGDQRDGDQQRQHHARRERAVRATERRHAVGEERDARREQREPDDVEARARRGRRRAAARDARATRR